MHLKYNGYRNGQIHENSTKHRQVKWKITEIGMCVSPPKFHEVQNDKSIYLNIIRLFKRIDKNNC